MCLLSKQDRLSVYRKVNMAYVPFRGLKNINLDLCAYLGGALESLIIDLFIGDIKKFSNMYHSCPFSVMAKNYLLFKLKRRIKKTN